MDTVKCEFSCGRDAVIDGRCEVCEEKLKKLLVCVICSGVGYNVIGLEYAGGYTERYVCDDCLGDKHTLNERIREALYAKHLMQYGIGRSQE